MGGYGYVAEYHVERLGATQTPRNRWRNPRIASEEHYS